MPFKSKQAKREWERQYQRRKYWQDPTKHRDRNALLKRVARQLNSGNIRDKEKLYRENNVERFREWNRQKHARHYAREIAKDEIGYLYRRYLKSIQRKFGLREQQYLDLLERQNNKCPICGDKFKDISSSKRWERPAVDHCHNGGHVRALLCVRCNSAIAMLRHSSRIAKRALKYLEQDVLFNGL